MPKALLGIASILSEKQHVGHIQRSTYVFPPKGRPSLRKEFTHMRPASTDQAWETCASRHSRDDRSSAQVASYSSDHCLIHRFHKAVHPPKECSICRCRMRIHNILFPHVIYTTSLRRTGSISPQLNRTLAKRYVHDLLHSWVTVADPGSHERQIFASKSKAVAF